MKTHRIVSRDEWLVARRQHLAKEKELTRQRDELARQRRDLPWVKVEKRYEFDGPDGKLALADLFGRRSQLVIYHFMFGPDWQEGCPSCSFVSDHIDGAVPHLAARDVSLAMMSRAPFAKIAAFKKRMGWRFEWVSSYGSEFNRDFHVSFTQDEMASGRVDYNYTRQQFPSQEAPGLSVFYRDAAGDLFHTYSAFGRGLDPLVGTYTILDLVPKGRDEDHLAFTMEWVRHHDRYGSGELADADRPYWPEEANRTAAGR
ncbi:MAG TPA: thioredoxin family protein [Myxococcota bacterium]|nr:thioredoxin family protein [Myxococcota bacterium]